MEDGKTITRTTVEICKDKKDYTYWGRDAIIGDSIEVCPWCGNTNQDWCDGLGNSDSYEVTCDECGGNFSVTIAMNPTLYCRRVSP